MIELTEETYIETVLDIQANKEDDIMVIDFYRPSCTPCRKMAMILESIESNSPKHIHFFKVNVDECEDVAKHSRISTLPTIYILGSNGLIEQFTGIVSKSKILESIGV